MDAPPSLPQNVPHPLPHSHVHQTSPTPTCSNSSSADSSECASERVAEQCDTRDNLLATPPLTHTLTHPEQEVNATASASDREDSSDMIQPLPQSLTQPQPLYHSLSHSPPRSLSLLVNTDDIDDVSECGSEGGSGVPPSSTRSTHSLTQALAQSHSSPSSSSSSSDTVVSPLLYFTHSLREERSRSKLCVAVGNCMNDMSHIEEIFGKQFLKIGSQCHVREEEWPVVPNKVWDQIGTTMERLGKQHIGFHLCVSQSIARGLNSLGSSISKQAQELEAEIQLLVHDLNKQHSHYKKSYQKYVKLIRDAEAAIKAREEAIILFTAKMNRSEKEATTQDVTSYLNRGLNKMISKIIPTDDFKTIHDRCRSLMTDIDDLENKLVIHSDRLKMLHSQLQDKAMSMSRVIEKLEAQRLEHTKDGLLRFCQASEGMLEHNKNILETLRELTTAAAAGSVNNTSVRDNEAERDQKEPFSRSEDMVSLEMELALLVNIMQDTDTTYDNTGSNNASNQSVHELVGILNEEGDGGTPGEVKPSIVDVELSVEIHLHTFEKLKNALSILGNINYQATAFFSEVADVEQNFCVLTTKLFETYGYKYTTGCSNHSGILSGNVAATFCNKSQNSVHGHHDTQESARELISEYESPMTRIGWDSMIRAVEHFTEAHSMSSELLLQQCSVSTDEAQRNIESSCQEKALRVQELTRAMDNMKSQQTRLETKLSRTQKELRDRKVSNSPARESVAADRHILRNQVLLTEEENLKQQLVVVTESVNTSVAECATVLEKLVQDFKNEIQSQLEGIIISYQEFLDSNNIKFNIWQRVIRKVRDDVELIDIEQDLVYYKERVKSKYVHHLGTLHNTDEDLGLPKLQRFVAIRNTVVDLERNNERIPAQYPVSPTNESTGGSKVFGSIIGGFKAVGDIGIHGGTKIMEGVSRGRAASKKDAPQRRSLSAGEGTQRSGDNMDSKELDAVNDKYQVRRRGSVSGSEGRQAVGRSQSDGISDDNTFSPLEFQASGVSSESGSGTDTATEVSSRKSDDTLTNGYKRNDLSISAIEYAERIDNDIEITSTPTPTRPKSMSVLGTDRGCDDDDDNKVEVASLRLRSHSLDSTTEVSDITSEGVILAAVPAHLPEPPMKELPARVNPELVKFGIEGEKIIEHFSCALIPKRGLLTHGRMFITKNHIAFSGWPELRVLIPLENVVKLKKTNTVYIIPNAITVHTVSGEMYFFGSFIDRDPCFEILSSMVNIARSLVQVMGPSLTRTNDSYNNDNVDVNLVTDGAKLADTSEIIDDTVNNDTAAGVDTVAQPLVASRPLIDPVSKQHIVALDKIVDFDALFDKYSITKLHDAQLDVTSTEVWQVGWQKNAGYRKFLESEGDIEIQMSEWEPFNELVEKDLSKLTFHFRRTCTYLHPRTSMLMFGPKNATAQQVQYLHLPEWVGKETSHVTVENLNKMYPVSNAIVMSATQFEGIPMSDVFKVYMYWTFEAVRSSEEQSGATSEMTTASLCRVRMGLRVDFLKSTMLRSQIFAGTKEELEVLSKQWEQFQIDELEAHSKRQDLALLSNKGTVGVFTDSDDSDDDSDTDAVSKHNLIKEQVKAALIEHDKLRGSVVDNIWMPSPFLFGVIVLVLVLQFVLIFIMLRRMSTLSDMVEGLVASDKQCHTR